MTVVFNRQDLLIRVDGDVALMEELLAVFLEYLPQQLQKMRQALDAGDVLSLAGQAHALKGAAASIGAEAMCAAAWELELAGKKGALEQSGRLVQNLTQEFSRLQSDLAGADSRG